MVLSMWGIPPELSRSISLGTTCWYWWNKSRTDRTDRDMEETLSKGNEPLRGELEMNSYGSSTLDPPHEHEFLSGCCGAPESGVFAGFCAKCRDHAVFECECGASRLSRHDEVQYDCR